ncbi:MAG: FtsK/SpoIIIE domain-containing protein [Clostridium sp.]|nr:FtsK/SpoIIIE domain-containing protein [Clostridium sp.]
MRGLAEQYSPKEVNMYILDFASMILRNFEDLNHVGGVVTSSDEERLKGFLKLMQATIQIRKKYFAQLGLSSYSAYRESGQTELPQIVIFLDNWVAFRGYFPDYEDIIVNISRESISVGITLIVTAAQASGAGFKLLSNFSKRTALYCNDSSDYGVVFEACRRKINDIAGRGIVEANKTYYEIQYYLAFAADKEFEKIKLMKEFIQQIHDKYGDEYVAGIPEIPQNVTDAYMTKQYGGMYLPYEVPVGMEFNTIDKRTIRLDQVFMQSFVGAKNQAKHKYIEFMLDKLLSNNATAPVELYVIDELENEYKEYEDVATAYTTTIPGVAEIMTQVVEKLKERYEKSKTGQLNLDTEPLQLIVVNSTSMMKLIGTDKATVELYKMISTMLKDMKVCFLLTDVENAMIAFSAGDLLKQIRDTKRVIVFEDIKNIKVVDVPMGIARDFKKALEPNDAYMFNGDKLEKIRVIEQ